MIKAYVDANVLISHLLNPTSGRPPNRIVEAGTGQEFELVLIEATLSEMVTSVQGKPYLASRIDAQSVQQLESALRLTATVVPESISDVPRLSRDPGDDYLIVHAILHEVDFLISGDRDLLELGEFDGLRIVGSAEFVAILDDFE